LEHGAQVIEEWWMPPAGGALQGMARTVRGDQTREYELTRIVRGDDGSLAFEAHPSGQPAALFPLVRWEGHRAVFEDPAHDFPQRVIYDLSAADRLFARVEGVDQGTTMAFDYPYRRVACVPDNPRSPIPTNPG